MPSHVSSMAGGNYNHPPQVHYPSHPQSAQSAALRSSTSSTSLPRPAAATNAVPTAGRPAVHHPHQHQQPWWKSESNSADSGWDATPRRKSILSTILSDLWVIAMSPCCWLPLPTAVHHVIHRKRIGAQVAAQKHRLNATAASVASRQHAMYVEESDARSAAIDRDRRAATARDAVSLQLTDDQIIECKESFLSFDPDMDGVINNRDLAQVLQSLGQPVPTDDEVSDMVAEIESYRSQAHINHPHNANDTSNTDDGNVQKIAERGTIAFPDFLALVARKLKDSEAEEELKQAFQVFDRDGDGMVSVDELHRAMRSLGEKWDDEATNELIDAADTDGDGFVDYQDLIKRLMSD